MTLMLVAIGAAIGAPLRYLIDRAVQSRRDSRFPWGTFTVNILGSFVLALIATASLHTPGRVYATVGIGLCGALTTYSTFGYETLRLFQQGAGLLALLNVAVSVTAAMGAAYLGSGLAQGFSG